MAIKNTGNFIKISPDASMQGSPFPIATFNISGINEEDTTEYYPIMSNFYDTALWLGTGTLRDANNNTVPPQALQGYMVNKIIYSVTVYWLSTVNNASLIYRAIENSDENYITISTTDDWNTYTVTASNGGIY